MHACLKTTGMLPLERLARLKNRTLPIQSSSACLVHFLGTHLLGVFLLHTNKIYF
jgi:hypothetical protein